MIQISNTLISQDLLDQKFCCDLEKCKGACCVKGDSGAPLTDEEVLELPKIIDKIKPFLRNEGVECIEKIGTHVIDMENDAVTPLINGQECAFVLFEQGIAKCGIEKAYFSGAIKFRKPISCFLYPVRIKKYEKFTAVNYDKWSICEPAIKLGNKLALPVYVFVKDALVERFGNEWYEQLGLSNQALRDKK